MSERVSHGVRRRRRTGGGPASLSARAEPLVWVLGGALVICLAMILGLLALVGVQGVKTFWPQAVVRFELRDGRVAMGEVTRSERYDPRPGEIEAGGADPTDFAGPVRRRLLRTGNFELSGEHFRWVSDFEIVAEGRPEWAVVLERLEWGRFYGMPREFRIDGTAAATGAEAAWAAFLEHHDEVRERRERRRRLESHEIGLINARLESARLAVRGAELEWGEGSEEAARARARFERVRAEEEAKFAEVRERIEAINRENERYSLVMETAGGKEAEVRIVDVVRGYPANRLDVPERWGVYLSRWWEFLSDEPRQANSEGGVWPAIFGTVVMTLLMSMAVMPFGVLAALYLHEYAKAGIAISTVRIAVNNLAGVPSIVFGVFGLGFFCYMVGGGIDAIFFEERLPNPTFGTGGVLWASLTLALLTLPVVIVATEEALAAVPRSMREGSIACGATKWQTIRRIVLPRAMPGLMTGMILAMARGAGEVAPLMLVGAVKLADKLPIDTIPPYVHAQRSFMHLGFHIYDLGFQSQNSEAAKPMVYTTTLLLVTLVIGMNAAGMFVRARLRRRFRGGQF